MLMQLPDEFTYQQVIDLRVANGMASRFSWAIHCQRLSLAWQVSAIFVYIAHTLVRQPHYAGGWCADGDHLQDARSQGCEDDAAVCESDPKDGTRLGMHLVSV